MDKSKLDKLRAARANTKSRGSAFIKTLQAGLAASRSQRPHLHAARLKGAATRRAQGEATYARLLELASQGATLREAMYALGLSENGVRKNLHVRLGSGAWPPVFGEK
tara:strand:- start:2017 stop:2340 length:324 start_codon:yes stop_codon:yes gene_type:complete